MEPFGFESGASRSMSSFRIHEENYHRASQAINRHINGLQLKKAEALAAIDLPAELEEAEQYVKGMEIEVRSMKGNERRQCQSRANQCRADLRALRISLEQATHRAQAEALLHRGNGRDGAGSDRSGNWNTGSGALEGFGPDAAQQSLARSRMSLLDSQRVVEETEAIGQGAIGDLESQRESLLRSQANMRETGSIAERARRVLRNIARRDFRHRLCLYFVIVCLTVAILLVSFMKFQKYFGSSN